MTRLTANAVLLFAAFLWGTGNVAQKLVLEDLGPVTTVGFRCLIGFLVIMPLLGRNYVARIGQTWPHRALIAVVALLFAAAITAQQIAFGTTSVTNGSFLICATSVLTPVAAWLLLRVRPGPVIWTAVSFVFFGAFLLAGGSLVTLAPGDAICLVSAALYSFWFVLLGVAVVRSGDPATVTIFQFLLCGIACLAVGIALEPFAWPRLLAALPELIILGVFSTGLAFLLQTVAQKVSSATEAALITSAESVFGMLAGMMVLGEELNLSRGVGAGLILASILTVQIAPAIGRIAPHASKRGAQGWRTEPVVQPSEAWRRRG